MDLSGEHQPEFTPVHGQRRRGVQASLPPERRSGWGRGCRRTQREIRPTDLAIPDRHRRLLGARDKLDRRLAR